jgi:NAD(P)-dependent dehydrogenase (short-subunit alcohol dehydrogenase family)
MNTTLLGATRGMGRALVRRMAERGDELFLLGRDPEDLARSAADLAARSGRDEPPGIAPCDLEDPATFEPALAAAEARLGKIDTVVLTAGLFAAQEELEADPERLARLLAVDFSHAVLFCEAARKRLLASGGGTLCVFSSVAGERGRKPVVLYGAAKAGLTRYLEGLDHRFYGRGLRVVTVKPGFVKTDMTEGLPAPPFAGEPERVARDVLRALDRGTPVVYTPGAWRWVMAVIRRLPRFVMRRVGF